MALSEDQRALLRLLLAGDTYEHVAEVLGTTPADVRTRAHHAEEALERNPDPELEAGAVSARLAALEGTGPAVTPPSAGARPAVDRRRWALWGALGAAVVLAAVVIAVTRHDGGSDTTSSSPSSQEEAVPIRLEPVNGSKASGGVTLIRIGDQPAIDLAIRGLAPTGRGQTYVLWFVGSGGRSLPVAFRAVGPDGKLSGRAAIPSAATGLLPSFTTAELALARQSEAAAAVRQAAQNDTLPTPVGRIVMRGALRG
jgi:hypothetical protein